jgi:hypothetical protein
MLENRAMISIDQDGIAARRFVDDGSEQVFAKQQPNGVWYIGVFNTDPFSIRTFRLPLAQLGLGYPVRAADVWTGRSLGLLRGSFSVTVAPGGVALIAAVPATPSSS